MWIVESIGVSEIRGSIDKDDLLYVPYLDCNMNTHLRFQHIWVTLRNPESNDIKYICADNKHWGRLGGAMHKYNPYGCVDFKISDDGYAYFKLVAVDLLSYQFLNFVDGFTPVTSTFALQVARRRHFIAMDAENTLFHVRVNAKARYGFPLMKIILSTPENWSPDGEYHICLGFSKSPVYTVNFTDIDRVRAFLGKASMLCGDNPVKAGIRASHVVYI